MAEVKRPMSKILHCMGAESDEGVLSREAVLAKRINELIDMSPGTAPPAVSEFDVQEWARGSRVPAEYVRLLERITRYRVMRYHIRPDIYPREEYEEIRRTHELRHVLMLWCRGSDGLDCP